MKFPWLPNSPNSLASKWTQWFHHASAAQTAAEKAELSVSLVRPALNDWRSHGPSEPWKRMPCVIRHSKDMAVRQPWHGPHICVPSHTTRVISESEGSTVQHVSTMFHTYASPSLSNHSNHYPIDSSTEVQYHFRNHRCEEVIDSFSGLLPPVPSSHMWDAKPQSSTRKWKV